ncbi:MAG: CHAT domain-containing protein [Cyanobacteria bacterium J06649_11]
MDNKPTQIDKLDPFAAVIYPIILADRLEVILSLPQQPLRHYATSLPQEKLESIIEELRQKVVIRSRNNFLPLSQQIYDWLIRPIESDLTKSGIETLIFVLDGDLRNIPMAVLHDGNQNYLIEKYNIALTPSLELLPPKKLEKQKFKILGAGLTESRDGFSPLEYVEEEMKQIKSEMPSKILLDRKFISQNLQTYLQSDLFPIVHIATHGQFSSKAEETFLLAWDDRININSLGNLLETSETGQGVELLVLSACETAVGDKAATLGLAGMAVKTGASSTLATLWSVNDEGTANFIHEFYKHLRNANATKAEALRQAQIALLKNPQYKHPIYWAPYILVGNWL